MSIVTENLGLIKPEIADEIHQTIVDLANNFQKISDVAEIYMNGFPTSGYWIVSDRVWSSTPIIGGYAGWINIREGTAASKWSSLTSFTLGDLIVPTIDNGHYYTCTQTGYSAVNEPTFPVTSGGTVEDTMGKTTWQASTTYAINDIVVPSIGNNRFYVCTVAGISGSTEPIWSTVDGGTVSDGAVVWIGFRILIWQEQGISAHFRPFGKID